MGENAAARTAWYGDGLRFECTGCGWCCTGGHGYVWVVEQEIRDLAGALGLDLEAFGRRYLRRVGARYALLESPRDGACVFLAGSACSVYATRPRQCRSYPFWSEILATPETWRREAADCEGIRESAPLVTCAEIDAKRRR